MKQETMNDEGMTWKEWIAAAMFGKGAFAKLSSAKRQQLREAWEKGEDPTEYAAR